MNSKYSDRYTKEILEPAVKKSRTVSEVVREIGLKYNGGVHSVVLNRIKKLGIDFSHFTGMGRNSGPDHKGGPAKKTWKEVLILRSPDQGRENTWRLRRAMLELGIKHECSECSGKPVWNGKPLCLHVDHRDGNKLNCTPENVRFLCPNCHSQTPQCCQGNGVIGLTDVNRYRKLYCAGLPSRVRKLGTENGA